MTQFDRSAKLDETRVFTVSENGLIVANRLGIFLYYIPGPRATGSAPNLVPVWDWRGDASNLRGTLYKTASPYHALWLQGMQATHTLEFDADESGCFPVVVNHKVTGDRPVFQSAEHLELRGRKGMRIESGLEGEVVFHTGILEKPGLTRRLRASVPGLHDDLWGDEFKYADLDELTGRIMFVVGLIIDWGRYDFPYAQEVYIADLPV
jgi:hypothetical protein